MNIKTIVLIALSCAALLFGCSDPFSMGKGPAESEAGYGTVSVSFTGDEGRTLFPARTFSNYVYTFTKEGGEAETLEPTGGSFTLEVGIWTIAVDAYAGDVAPANLAATGSAEFTLANGETKAVSINLEGVTETGKGTFTFTVNYPAGTTVTEISLKKLPELTVEVALGLSNGATSSTKTVADVDAGFYLFTVKLANESKIAGTNEVVHIYNKLTSTYTETFTTADFDAVPVKWGDEIINIPVTAVGGDIELIEDGYQFTRTAGYANGFAWFKLDLDDLNINNLADIEQVKFTYQGVSGDLGYKEICLVAGSAVFTAPLPVSTQSVNKAVLNGSDYLVGPRVGTGAGNTTTAVPITLDIWRTKTEVIALTSEVYFSIFMNADTTGATGGAGSPTVINITGIEFVEATGAAFDPVTDIDFSEVGTDLFSEDELDLSNAKVIPPFATNQTISWSVETDGGTSANITGNTLTATNDGTVRIKATIINGTAVGTNYTQSFDISVSTTPPPTDFPVLVDGVEQRVTISRVNGGNTKYIADGFRFDKTGDYGNGHAWFKIDFGSGNTLADFSKFTFTIEGESGSLGSKRVGLWAGAAAATGWVSDANIVAGLVNTGVVDVNNIGPQYNIDSSAAASLIIDPAQAAANAPGQEAYFSIYIHSALNVIKFTNIKFVKGGVISNPQFTGWGGAGDATANSFDFLTSAADNSRITYDFSAQDLTGYTTLTVNYTLTRKEETPSGKPMKISINNRAKDDWDTEPDFKEWPESATDTALSLSKALSAFATSKFLTFEHNTDQDQSGSFTITVTSIVFD